MSHHRFSRSEFLALTRLLAGSALLAPVVSHAAPAKPQASKPATAPPTRAEVDAIRRACRGSVTGTIAPDPAAELIAIGEWMRRQGTGSDFYGQGELVESFEKKLATLLGFPAACYMPTGTMAQLIALRIYADARGNRNVGLHPSSHHVLHEDSSHVVLHNLRDVILSPWTRPLLARDVQHSPDPLGTVSVELPVRWLGGQLQTWEQLQELKSTCREKNVKLHMDGARLWECQPFYDRPLADICRGFDSVYVSLYKRIGALSGAMLVGSEDFIREARLWRHRHGGNLYHHYPSVVSAAMRLDGAIAGLPALFRRTKALSEALAADPRLTVQPRPIQTNMFRVYVRGDAQAFSFRSLAQAKESRIWLGGFAPTRVPGIIDTELEVTDGLNDLTDAEIVRAYLRLLDEAT